MGKSAFQDDFIIFHSEKFAALTTPSPASTAEDEGLRHSGAQGAIGQGRWSFQTAPWLPQTPTAQASIWGPSLPHIPAPYGVPQDSPRHRPPALEPTKE